MSALVASAFWVSPKLCQIVTVTGSADAEAAAESDGVDAASLFDDEHPASESVETKINAHNDFLFTKYFLPFLVQQLHRDSCS